MVLNLLTQEANKQAGCGFGDVLRLAKLIKNDGFTG